MLTRDTIRKNLLRDRDWEPDEDISNAEWEMFDEIYDELESSGKLGSKNDVSSTSEDDDTWDDEEEE
jgi:hypothetical protein